MGFIIKTLHELEVYSIELEGDSKIIIYLLLNRVYFHWRISPNTDYWRIWILSFNKVIIKHTLQEGNKDVDYLAMSQLNYEE